MGVSALVDPAGRVLEPTTVEGIVDGYRVGMESEPLAAGRWKEFKAKPILLGAEIPLSSMNAPYVQWGDWLAWSFDLALVLFLGISLWRKRFGKTPSGKAEPSAMIFGQPRFDGSAS
jgi:apolipoprotein N-acyltransferase